MYINFVDFSSAYCGTNHFHVCMDCIKGKQTKHTKKGATRSNELIEIIHTDICGPLSIPCFTGEKYFITCIDDLSRYGYVYLMHEKSQAIDIFEMFITEVERQLDKKIKIVRSDRGGEYYGRYDESGQNPGPFAKFLEKSTAFVLSTQCLVRHNIIVLLKGVIAH